MILLDIIYIVAAVFYLPAFLFKGKHRVGFRERFGIYKQSLKDAFKERKSIIWLHAVSVGEMKAAAFLLERLHHVFPEKRILISTITPTGNVIAHQLASKLDLVIYFPFDLKWVVKKALDLIKPEILLIMETEIWPNMIIEASKRKIPVAVINGRISDQAFPRYQWAGMFFKPIVQKINLFCMQTAIDADRITILGADKQRVHVVGNLKFDQARNFSSKNLPRLGLKKEEQLIVAGSTHPKEEEMIIEAFLRLKADYPKTRLLIAPRHPHRAQEIDKIVKGYDLNIVFTSQIPRTESMALSDCIFILDQVGALNQFYELADIVFVGGSLIPHGGQNPIEPAVCAKVVIFGKYMFNFARIAKLFLDNNAAICVNDANELYLALHDILGQEDKRKTLAQKAKDLVLQNKGATQRVLGLLQKQFFNV